MAIIIITIVVVAIVLKIVIAVWQEWRGPLLDVTESLVPVGRTLSLFLSLLARTRGRVLQIFLAWHVGLFIEGIAQIESEEALAIIFLFRKNNVVIPIIVC